MLKELPDHVQLYINDDRYDDTPNNNEINKWLKKYNIFSINTMNTAIIEAFDEAKALKKVHFSNIRSSEALDPLFRLRTTIHLLSIVYSRNTK